MPEFIHSFQRGRMNKDLDERLMPNGEYRDALNLDIANSEGSNVGALQNVKGNVELRDKTSTDLWQDHYIEDLSNPVCIGSIRHDIKETIYWFIASDNASAIVEYDQTTGIIKPVLVDKNGILNFSEQYLITGINILDKFLFWTDDQTEPKKINIEKFKRGSVDFNTHTKIPIWTPFNNNETVPSYVQVTLPTTQPDFTEEDITVIKKSPLTAPTLDTAASPFGDNINGTGITPVYTTAEDPAGTGTENFTFVPNTLEPAVTLPLDTYGAYLANIEESPTYYANSNIPNWNGLITFDVAPIYDLTANNGNPVWQNDDILLLNGRFTSQFNETFEYQLRVQIESLSNSIVTAKILGISSDLYKPTDENGDIILIQWEVLLEEKEPMFEYVFPRFAYRWKYIDNEYSAFSPFTDVAFVGNDFKYLSSDGYNVGMTNNIRKLIVENLTWGSEEVAEVEILFKQSHNTTVYVVDSIKKREYSPYSGTNTLPTNFEITSEIIGNVVQANQLLRPWDNVPLKAKSQEIIGNRIIYGNYLQNYNIDEPINLTVSYLPKVHPANLTVNQETQPNPFERQPFASLKSIRTYQAGIVFKDEYGRETPVQTTKTASINIPILDSASTNVLQITPSGNAPSWATHFKFFIKETSNEYYNLALDRFYFAEDGNVWLSFPSSERNKLDEETYLILKKQHDNNVAVDNLNRYKVLAIENEAPDFIKTFESTIARATVEITSGFEQDFITLIFNCGTTNTLFKEGFKSTRKLQIVAGANVTDKYDIKSGGPTGVGTQYTITLERPLGFDAAWLSSYGPSDNIDISILEDVVENKQEFEGRFFAKINRDFAFDTNIVASFDALEPRYAIRAEHNVENQITGIAPGSGGIKMGWLDDRGYGHTTPFLPKRPSNGSNKFTLNFAGWPYGGGNSNVSLYDYDIDHYIANATIGPFEYNHMRGTGILLRFISSTGEVSDNIYKITAYERKKSYRGYTSWPDGGPRQRNTNMRKTSYYTMNQNYNETFLPTGIQVVEEIIEDDNKLLTSSNPAIFETEPKEAVDLDIYYEASDAIPVADYNNIHQLTNYYNCYSYGQGVESNRIRDDYNAFTIDKGPKVSAPLDEPYGAERRGSGMIFSQIYNSTSGINRLNQFIQAEPITKDLNPIYGTIQKLHARDTDAIVLCEDKCLRILANKDALYNADGNVNLTGNNAVLGQAVPYAGEFGISKNPESFASYAFRAYFSDKNRGAVIRLSADGITNIAGKGMSDFFADNLRSSTKILGSYDDDKDLYNITLDNLSQQWVNEFSSSQDYQLNPDCNVDQSGRAQTTVSFKESVDGWTGRKSFIPESGVSLNNIYYTFKGGRIYQHNLNTLANNFYRVQYDSSFNVFINEMPQVVKGFSAINYTGTQSRRFEYLYNAEWYSIAEINFNTTIPTAVQQKQPGWYVNYVKTDLEGGEVKEFEKKEGKWFNYIKALEIFNDCEEIPDGIGNPDVVDSEPQDYILTVTIDEGCSTSGGSTPDTIQFFVNIWDNIKNDPALELNIVNETTAQDVKCAIDGLYDLLYQSYGGVTNSGTAFSYQSGDGLQAGTQMYNSLTNEPITSAGAYLFVGAGEQMSDLTVSHAGLDANNPTVVPSAYYVMILDSNGQIASWTQYNTLNDCQQEPLSGGAIHTLTCNNQGQTSCQPDLVFNNSSDTTDLLCDIRSWIATYATVPGSDKRPGYRIYPISWYSDTFFELNDVIYYGASPLNNQLFIYYQSSNPNYQPIQFSYFEGSFWTDVSSISDEYYIVATNGSGEVIQKDRINTLTITCP